MSDYLTRAELDRMLVEAFVNPPKRRTDITFHIDDSPETVAAFVARSGQRRHVDIPRMAPYSDDAEAHGVKRCRP